MFRVRQNASGPALVQAVGNRALILAVTLPQLSGRQLDSSEPAHWVLLLSTYLGLLVVGMWLLRRVIGRG